MKEKIAAANRNFIKLVKVSEEIQNTRMAICDQCEEFFKPLKTCKKCGCFMVAKTYIPSARCPINKWGPEGE
jgi:rRNA maturation endonuclease Nob1